MKLLLKGLVLLLTLSMLSSCVSKKKYMELEEAKNSAMSELRDAKASIADLEDTKSRLESELAKVKKDLEMKISSLESEVADCEKRSLMTKEELASRESKIKQLNSAISKALHKKSGVAMTERGGSIYLVMDNNILYSSGSARINKEGRSVIKQMANVLKGHPDVGVLVESHTDHKKLVEGSIYTDNWDLSSRRSNNVVRLLTKYGVDSSQLGSSSRAEYKPVHSGDNLTGDQLKENRRTEFMILPNLSGLYNM